MSCLQSLKLSQKIVLLWVELLVLGGLAWWGLVQYWPAAPASTINPLQEAWAQSQAVGKYKFNAEAEQLMLPRPIPLMIGQTDQHVTMRLEGEVVAPAETQFTLSMKGKGLDPTPIAIVQNGAESYMLRNGEKIPLENPAGLLTPTGDSISYLAAAQNIEPCGAEVIAPPGAGACYAFKVDGPSFAQHVLEQMQAQLEANPAALPPGATWQLSPPAAMSRMNGNGRVWLDAHGLPLKMNVNLGILEASELYDAQADLVVNYAFDEPAVAAAQQQARTTTPTWLVTLQTQLPGMAKNALLLGFSLIPFGLAVVFRRQRWLYGALVIFVSASMVLTPLLQVAAYAKYNTAHSQNALTTAANLLVQPADDRETAAPVGIPAPPPADSPAVPAVDTYIPDTYCGKGSATLDRDSDGLLDAVENCLGTNPNAKDSDYDGIPDGVEANGFEFDGKTWYTDPLKSDSNGDGLTDGVEWKKTDEYGQAASWDIDFDKVPNVWDFDDDGDGVADINDLSPFSATDYKNKFSLNILGQFDGYIYLNLQLQPGNFDHLRYTNTALDWRDGNWVRDIFGQIKDLDQSTDDFRLTPMLEVYANKTPEAALIQKYGISVFEKNKNSQGYTRMFLPLDLVGDGTRVEAFSTHIAYSAATLRNLGADGIKWEDAKIIWMVQGKTDSSNAQNEVVINNLPVQIVKEYTTRISGWQVVKSKDYHTAILGTPDNAGDDRQLFQLLLGLNDTFLNDPNLKLSEIKTRFSNVNTPVQQKWGVTTRVAVDVPADPDPHQDQGRFNLDSRVKTFLTNQYNLALTNTVIIATEEKTGLYNQDDLSASSTAISVDLSKVDLITRRSLSLDMRHGWEGLSAGAFSSAVASRVSGAVMTALQDLKGEYPQITAANLLALTESIYMTWATGRSRIMSMDNLTLTGQPKTDQEVYEQVYLTPKNRYTPANTDTLPGYLIEVGQFAQKGGGLLFTGGPGQTWQYLQANAPEAWRLGFNANTVPFFNTIDDVINQNLNSGSFNAAKLAESPRNFFNSSKFDQSKLGTFGGLGVVDTAIGITKEVGKLTGKFTLQGSKIGRLASALNKDVFKALKGTSRLGVASLVADIGLTWVSFGTKGDFSTAGVATAIATTAFSVMLFAISLNPVGAVLVAIFGLVDFILAVIPGVDLSLSGEAIKLFVASSSEWVTKVDDYRFEGGENKLIDVDQGYAVGNRFRISANFVGKIIGNWKEFSGTSDFTDSVEDSSITGSYRDGQTYWDSTWHSDNIAQKNDQPQCTRHESTLTCTNTAGVEFTFTKAKPNIQFYFKQYINAKTISVDCLRILFYVDCDNATKKLELPTDLKQADQWASTSIYLDVLPGNLDDIWNWAEMKNPDPDGDGLLASAEDKLKTDKAKWDTDGDGLSDRFESDQMQKLGTDATKADTDGDGLNDRLEYQLGTRINSKDSDGDGLTDSQEIYHPDGNNVWSGGWTVRLNGKDYHVFSDPLNEDLDGDGLTDLAEKENGTSPAAYNKTPQLTLATNPVVTNPASGLNAIYVKPGDNVAFTTRLAVYPPYTVSTALQLSLPAAILDNISVAPLTGDRTPANSGTNAAPKWSFASAVLQPWEVITAVVTARAKSSLGQSAEGSVTAQLPHASGNQNIAAPIIVDADVPYFSLTSPDNGAIFGGGASAVVVGGYAKDITTWIEHVNLNIPGQGAVSLDKSQPLSPWAYTWNLPGDGLHTLSGTATDFVNNVSAADSVEVLVDNTPAAVTINLADNAVYGPPKNGKVISIALNGTATDNLSNLIAVELSTDDGPWREVWSLNKATGGNTTFVNRSANFAHIAAAATWSTVWELPNIESVQGYHSVKIRAFDEAGNWPVTLERKIIVDVIPPSDELTERTYLYNFPQVPAGSAHTFHGVANDAGNVPQPSRPVDLSGSLNSLTDATIQLGLASIDDSVGGVHATWIGDFNGDRRDDLLVGLPAAAGGRGQISIIYGRSGDWPVPNEQEMLANSPSSFVGAPGAGLGNIASPAGDVNGDGRADLLIGDPANNRAFVVFGQSSYLGTNVELTAPKSAYWWLLSPPAGETIGTYLGGAGDVNGDGFDDLLIGAGGAANNAYLLLGQGAPINNKTIPLKYTAAAKISGAGAATLTGLGDVNGDHKDEFGLGSGGKVYIFEGKGSYAPQAGKSLSLSDAATSLGSADSRPQLAALGDINGDHLDDFIYSSGGNQQVVYGDGTLDGSWATHGFSYGAGFVAAPGDVNRDGLKDILIGGGGSAYLVLGSSGGLGGAVATISGVAAAGSAPMANKSDLNSDGSSDLLLVPNTPAGQSIGVDSASSLPELPPAWLPTRLKTAALPSISTNNFTAVSGADAYVNAAGSCFSLTPCYSTIQAAVDARAAGDLIIVQPGVYAAFTINGKNNLEVRGLNPDAVFVDGAGGSFAATISNATGVRLTQMTFQNATVGVLLNNAGGYNPPTNKVVLDTVLVKDVTSNAISMSRTSALTVTHSTLAAPGNHINVTGTYDTNFDPSWTPMANAPWPLVNGGGILAAGDAIKAWPGGDTITAPQVYQPGPNSWSGGAYTDLPVPMGAESVMTFIPNGLSALGASRWQPLLGGDTLWNWTSGLAADPTNGNVYVGLGSSQIYEWDGSGWTYIFDGGGGPAYPIEAMVVHPDTHQVYVGGGPSYYVSRWNGTSWEYVGSTVLDQYVWALAYNRYNQLYAGTSNKVASYLGSTSWSTDNSVSGGKVDALAFNLSTNTYYAGGEFTSGPYGSAYIFSSVGSMGNVINGPVRSIAVDSASGDVYACGSFQSPGIARWDGSNWTILPEIVLNPKPGTNTCSEIIFSNGRLYAVGPWESLAGNKPRVVRWNGSGWDALAPDGGGGEVSYISGREGGMVVSGGYFNAIGRPGNMVSSNRVAGFDYTHYTYDSNSSTWTNAKLPPVPPGQGASYTIDTNDQQLYIPGGGSKLSYRYNPTDDTWSEAGALPTSVTASAMTIGKNGDVYAILSDGSFYRHDGTGWVSAGEAITTTLATIGDGVSLAYDIDAKTYYVLPGGNTKAVLRNTGTNWEALPAAMDTPVGINPGGGLVYLSLGAGKGIYAAAGGGSQALWRLVAPPQPNKLSVDNVAFVAPTAGNWLNLPDPLPNDFGVSGLGTSQWFGGTGWGPTNGETLAETGANPFVDQSAGLYRMGQGGYSVGYHTYRNEVTVAADGSGDFTSIQAGLNSGSFRVKIKPGVYEEQVYLPNGVEVLGSNADWTVIRHPGGNTGPLVQAGGVAQSSLALVTLDGNNANSAGLRVNSGAQDIAFKRSVIFNTGTAVAIDGAATDMEIANTTLALNANGVAATNCGPVDLRNTAIGYNSGVGLSYQSCAPTQLHTYNLFWQNNGGHFGANASAGAGELFIDPYFVDPTGGDYRTLNFSPVIDAGSPTDPAPPGAGNRIDIGYVEQGRAHFYVDAAYCELCANDGLTWQVDAFATIQAALNAAEKTVADLRAAPADVPQLMVAVAPGAYTGAVSVPSHVLLVGSGAEATTLTAGSGSSAVTFDGVTAAGVRDFTLTGAGSTGVTIKGAANDITIHHNIIQGTAAAFMVSGQGTGRAEFNTIVNNTTGATASGSGAWLEAENNIFSGNGTGLSAASSGQIFGRYNLLNNTTNYNGVLPGEGDVAGQSPQFTGGGTPYRLTVGSPARDAASLAADIPAGGGARADLGYSELLAAPVSLFLGKEDLSTAMGNSGVNKVEIGLVPVADDSQPYTATLPGAWSPVTLASPGNTVSYWQTNLTPPAAGVYRVYSRATDQVGNAETDETAWYAGSIVADNTRPVVTWLSPGSSPSAAPLELRAQVSDYVAGHFNVAEKDVYFVLNNKKYPATWAAEPWDEAAGQPRVFRAWVSLPIGSYTGVKAYAEDKADNNATASGPNFNITAIAPTDTTPPAVTVTQPTPGGYVTHTVTFKGTAADSGSGVAAVEISVDGGATWLPAAVSGGTWQVAWAGPEKLPFVSFPASARATDRAGNQKTTDFTFTIDEVPPGGLTPVTFSVPVETHLDSATNLGISWNAPSDGSGNITTLLTVDQITDTVPTGVVAGTSANRSLNASGDWYVHLGAADAIGNKTIRHYGPWHVGLTSGVAFGAKRQSIVVDGYLDTAHGEWQPDEFLDNDERNIGTNVTYSPDGQQSFYTTWSGDQFYMAWQGGWWDQDGTLWVYLNTGGGGSSQLISPVTGAVLPFGADYAVEITGPSEGRLWRNSGGWQQISDDWAFAQGGNGDTEIRLPLYGTTNIETLAFAQGDDGNVWAIFPATNPLMPGVVAEPEAQEVSIPIPSKVGGLVLAHAAAAATWEAYNWPDLTVVDEPDAGQPQAINAELALQSLQSTEEAQGPGGVMQYVVKIINQEEYTLTNQAVAFLVFPENALIHDSIAGASCATTAPAWGCTVDSVPPGVTAITLTTHLVTDLSSIPEVTMIAVLQNSNIPPEKEIQGTITHRTDSSPPVIEVANKPFVGRGLQTIQGTADDGDGIGVDYVEIQPEGGSWQRAQGSNLWSVDLTVSPFAQHGDAWRFAVRAVDLYGQVSEAVPYVFTVDLEGPAVSMSLPLTLTGTFNEIPGETNDSPTGSESTLVEAKLDDDIWREAALFEPAAGGEQPFLWTWNMPTEDGVTHTVELRSTDIVGNVGPTEPYTVTVDNVPPELTVTQCFTEVVVQNYRPTRLHKGPPVLTGTISDGGGVQRVAVRVELPDGDFYYQDVPVITNTWLYTPELTAVGTYTLMVEGTDFLSNTTRSEKYPLLVKAAPDTGDAPFLTFEDTPLIIEPLTDALDLDSATIFIESFGEPLHGTATLSGALVLSGTQVITGPTQLVYTPTLNFYGTDAFTYTASDGVLTGTANITITVLPVNDPPVITPTLETTISISEDTRLELPLTVVEVDQEPITWTVPISPEHGLVALSALTSTTITVVYTPTAEYNGNDTFTLEVSDGWLTATMAVNLDIQAVDDPPLAGDDAVLVLRDGADYTYVNLNGTSGLNVLTNDNDPDGLPLTVTDISLPNQGGTSSIAANHKSVLYQPTAAFTGTETFTYTVSDGTLTSYAIVSATVVNGSSGGGSGDTFTTGNTGISNTIALTVEIPATVVTNGDQLALVYTMLATPTQPLPPSHKFAGVMFTLDSYLNGQQTVPYTLTTPITLTITYSDTDVANLMMGDKELNLWAWDGESWRTAGITLISLDTELNQLVVVITTTGEFALLGRNAFDYYLPILFKGDGVSGLSGPGTIYLPIINRGDLESIKP